ncbi:MAG: hypothetical protein GF344_19780 [Chitinivibrionales bacterium]|nr:hypothetical protein [Chitinivibrionales bacterium]MBD3358855.1 hypothetical protein [Chitinivibrionales bacterium]
MVRILTALAAATHLMLSAGCSCDCRICCDTENMEGVLMEVCQTSENAPKQDCEDADGIEGCRAECR